VSLEALAPLRARVHADPALAMRLFAIDEADFANEVLRIAEAMGHDIEAVDLERALRDARRDWTLRWIR
jgi:chitinase